MIVTETTKLYTSSMSIQSFNDISVENSKSRFNEFQRDGIIKDDCRFEDLAWNTTDEYSNIGLHFKFNLFAYTNNYEQIFKTPFDEFIVTVKVFILSLVGRNALSSIQTVLLDLRHITGIPADQVYRTNDLNIALPSLVGDFFNLFSRENDENPDLDRLIYTMDAYADAAYGGVSRKQRVLADFDTYLLFNDLMDDFWRSPISETHRLFYYPLYLWWRLTAVIPLRPRELLLTPRDCLCIQDNEYYLRLRRNKIKGSSRQISYKITDDYVVETYKIPKLLGEDIQKYLDLTSAFDDTDLDTLFVADPHYRHWGQSKHSNSRYFTYTNLRTLLRCFYDEVIVGTYRLRIVDTMLDNGTHLADGEIGRIRLGDTRHLALINLMQSGGTPVAAMMLAGHDSINMASHYYSNVEHMIECKTYKQFRRVQGGRVQYQLSVPSELPSREQYVSLANNGKCFSERFLSGEITDCLSSVGPDGEIGYCSSCPYYQRSGISYFDSDDIYKRNIMNDCDALARAVELVRTQQGNIEDIGEAILKLQSSSFSYERFLMEKNQKHGG